MRLPGNTANFLKRPIFIPKFFDPLGLHDPDPKPDPPSPAPPIDPATLPNANSDENERRRKASLAAQQRSIRLQTINTEPTTSTALG